MQLNVVKDAIICCIRNWKFLILTASFQGLSHQGYTKIKDSILEEPTFELKQVTNLVKYTSYLLLIKSYSKLFQKSKLFKF